MTQEKQRKKRIMHGFKLLELSAVDRPAQEHARVVLQKRYDGDDGDGTRFFKPLPTRKLNAKEKSALAGGIQPVRDAETEHILKFGFRPTTGAEFDFYLKLEGAERRRFLSLDHQGRRKIMAGEEAGTDDDGDTGMKIARNRNDAASFQTFDEAVDHLKKSQSLSGLDAMRAARRQYPDLVEKMQAAGDSDVTKQAEDEVEKRQAGLARRKRVDNELAELMSTDKKLDRLTAMRRLRQAQPELFENA